LAFEWWALGPALAGALAASWVMMSGVESTSLAGLGLVPGVRAVTDFIRGFGLGAVLIGSVVVVMASAGWIGWRTGVWNAQEFTRAVLATTLLFTLAAFLEELVFRGYPFQVLAQALGPRAAVLLTAAAFAALHGANPGIGGLGFANTALAGILLGIMYWRTYSLWVVTGAHLGWNWLMSFAADLPVSGLEIDTPSYDAWIAGPDILTGGDYGPEGGLLLSLATVLGIAWVARASWLSRDAAVLELRPLPERT
jgi:membrane protease YdiL (CAAX protease family)